MLKQYKAALMVLFTSQDQEALLLDVPEETFVNEASTTIDIGTTNKVVYRFTTERYQLKTYAQLFRLLHPS
jgi:hypothetical protein